MHVIERVKSWLQGPQRQRLPEGVERQLAAYYWDGAAPAPREVRNVSPQGAYIVTSEKWYPGTIMDLGLEYNARPAVTRPRPPLRLLLLSKRVYHASYARTHCFA